MIQAWAEITGSQNLNGSVVFRGQKGGKFQCEGLAVGERGHYIEIIQLAVFGSEVEFDELFHGDISLQTGFLAFGIPAIVSALHAVILVFVVLARVQLSWLDLSK